MPNQKQHQCYSLIKSEYQKGYGRRRAFRHICQELGYKLLDKEIVRGKEDFLNLKK